MNQPFLPVWLRRARPRGGLWQGREGFPGPPGCPAPVFLHLLWAADCAQNPKFIPPAAKQLARFPKTAHALLTFSALIEC